MLRRLPPEEHIVIEVSSIVDREAFHAVQERLRANLLSACRRAKREYLLRGLVRCGNCAIGGTYAKMAGSAHDGGRRSYCGCLGHRNGPYTSPCGTLVRVEVVEEPVWAKREEWLRNPGEVVVEVAERLPAEEPDVAGAETTRQQLLSLLVEKEAELQRAIEMATRGIIGFADAEKQIGQANTESATIQGQLENVNDQPDRAGRALTRLYTTERVLAELREIADGGQGNWRRDVVTGLVDRVIVSSERLGAAPRTVRAVVYDRL